MGSFLVPGSVGLQVKFVRFEVISVSRKPEPKRLGLGPETPSQS